MKVEQHIISTKLYAHHIPSHQYATSIMVLVMFTTFLYTSKYLFINLFTMDLSYCQLTAWCWVWVERRVMVVLPTSVLR